MWPGWSYIPDKLWALFMSPGSDFSIYSLLCAAVIAALVYVRRRAPDRKPVKLAVLFRAVFPRWLTRHRSSRTDVLYFFMNTLFFGLLFGWALISYMAIGRATNSMLHQALGAMPATTLSPFVAGAILTVVMFIAYEFGYWLDHYLCHRIPFLWEFHKVHHSAEVLSPLTNARMHPVDSILFINIEAVVLGVTYGAVNYLFGETVEMFTISNANIIMVVFTFLTAHLQHSHVWLSFTGILGRIVLSPAHHQIHHSTNPVHFNKNLGGSLAVFDWLFGTLYIPSKTPEKLTFGIDDDPAYAHDLAQGVLVPFLRAGRVARRSIRRRLGMTPARHAPAAIAKTPVVPAE